MGWRVDFITAAIVAVCCAHFVTTATSFDSFDGDRVDFDSLLGDILSDINQKDPLGPNFSDNIEKSISQTLHENLDALKDLPEKIMLETKKLQEKNAKEQSLILDGRDGATLLLIESYSAPKKQYVIKDTQWYTCPDSLNAKEVPECKSGLVACSPDVCAFNGIVKYKVTRDETNPIYKESDIVCLIKGNANSVRQFSGVPEKTVKETCLKGDILTLKEYKEQCSEDQKLSYYYWPKTDKKVCNGNDYCDMIINWKVSSHGISQSTSGEAGSNSNNFSVVSSSVSNISKK